MSTKTALRFQTVQRILVVLTTIIWVFGSTYPVAAQTYSLNLIWPFWNGPTWKVVQGYNTSITHLAYQKYSLDLVRDDGLQAGKGVYAPLSGYVVWGGNSWDAQGCIAIRTLASSNYRVMLCHINFRKNFATNEYIGLGSQLGTVALNNTKGNRGLAHIHMTLYYLGAGKSDSAANREARPFTSTAVYNGAIAGANFLANDSIINTYYNIYGLCSNIGITPSLKMVRLETTDGYGYIKNVFRRNDSIWYWASVTNTWPFSTWASYNWTAFPAGGSAIMSYVGVLVDSPGTHWWRLTTTVPSTAATGYYTFRVKETYGGVTSCRVSIFRVNP